MDRTPLDARPKRGLRVENVFAGYGRVPVLYGVDLTVEEGECVALLGPNGVGKTTTIRTICGLLKPTGGNVYWNEHQVHELQPHEISEIGIALVPEGRGLYGGMTVEENLLMGAFLEKTKVVRERLEEIYSSFPILYEKRKEYAARLSGGQQQLCSIARALMSKPDLLLIDELSLGLSPKAIQQVVDAVQEVRKKFRLTIVLVEQDITVAAQLADKGYFINQGTVVGAGRMNELLETSYVKSLYFAVDDVREGG